MKGKKERVEHESSSSSESSCSEDESKAEGKVKAKKESKKVNLIVGYLLNLLNIIICFLKNKLITCFHFFMKMFACAHCSVFRSCQAFFYFRL